MAISSITRPASITNNIHRNNCIGLEVTENVMRICITSLPLDTLGGAERVIINEASYFAKQGHDVYLIAESIDKKVLSNYNLDERVQLITYDIVDVEGLDILDRSLSIRPYLNKIAPDVVQAHYVEIGTWLALQTLRITPAFTTHIHGSRLWFQDSVRRFPHLQKRCVQEIVSSVPGHSEFWNPDDEISVHRVGATVIEKLEKLALQACDVVFTNTRQLKKELNCLYDVKAEVTPPGIHQSWSADSQKVPDLPTDKPYILSVSRLDPRKRNTLLLRAFADMDQENIHLIIGGKGEQMGELKQLASEFDIEERVHLPGFIHDHDLPSYYKNAEIFAVPAWMSYGLTPLESISVETKTAISTDTYVKEIISEGSGVNVIPPETSAWTRGLNELLSCNSSPSPNLVPTINEYGDRKLDLMEVAAWGDQC
ncbi:glycosyltransferase family 4 protein [Haloarcula salina]|uniref:glycosyltransferase family 4 protein n=1 Tax=Haloarcula salina TaxID=1429914 RepID=UPI003C6FDD7F